MILQDSSAGGAKPEAAFLRLLRDFAAIAVGPVWMQLRRAVHLRGFGPDSGSSKWKQSRTAWILRWAVLAAAVGANGARAATWTIENAALSVALGEDGTLTATAKSTGRQWRAAGVESLRTRVGEVRVVARTDTALAAAFELDGAEWRLELRMTGTEPAFDLTLSAPSTRALTAEVRYPPAFAAPDGSYRFIVPQKTGLLFSVEQAAWPKVLGDYPSHGNAGLAMPWVGLSNLRDGLMLILETPLDCGVHAALAGEETARAFALQTYWRGSLETVRYPRRLHVRVFEEGGYVAMAKYYRQRLIGRGELVTLRQKAGAVPQLSRLMGALDLHLRGDEAGQGRLVQWFAERGVRRLLLNSDASPEMQTAWRTQGFLTGAYKLYTDIHPPGSRSTDSPALTRGYPDDAYTLRDGAPTRGYMASKGNPSTYRCSVWQLPLMAELIPPLLGRQGYEALFLDVVTSLPPKECWHPRHGLDCTADVRQRQALLAYATGLGLIVGSEDGSDWACAHLHYFEGMAMPRRFGYGKPPENYNNWRSRFPITEEYLRVDLNEQVRVPLFDLVYHDAVVSTWRWFYSPDLYARPEWWDNFDLLTMIAGNMPIFVLSEDVLPERGARILQTQRTAAAWHERIGWDELVDHFALTVDRTVQEARFSSGWAVIANFSRTGTFTGAGGRVVGPMGHVLYRWRETER
jgi:hypothetical protein